MAGRGWDGAAGRSQSQAGHTTPGQPTANQRRAQVRARQVGECGTRAHKGSLPLGLELEVALDASLEQIG